MAETAAGPYPTSYDRWQAFPLVFDYDGDGRDEVVNWGQSAIVIGKAPDFFEGIMMPEGFLAEAIGAVGKPLLRVHTAGSVGGSTAIVAASHVQAGVGERVLTIAWEQQSCSEAMWALSFPIPFQQQLVAGAGGYFAPFIREYMRRSNAPDDEGVDVALRVGRIGDSSLIVRKLQPIDFVVCATPAYWEQRGTPEHPDDLADHDALTYSLLGQPEWRFEIDGQVQSVPVRSRMDATDSGPLMGLALQGLGAVHLPRLMVQHHLDSGKSQTEQREARQVREGRPGRRAR